MEGGGGWVNCGTSMWKKNVQILMQVVGTGKETRAWESDLTTLVNQGRSEGEV